MRPEGSLPCQEQPIVYSFPEQGDLHQYKRRHISEYINHPHHCERHTRIYLCKIFKLFSHRGE